MSHRTLKKQLRARNKKRQLAIARRKGQTGRSVERDLKPDLQASLSVLPPVKVSEMIAQVAEPILADVNSPKAFENAIGLAIMAWNITLQDPCVIEDEVNTAALKLTGGH